MGLVKAPALCSERHRMVPKRSWARPTEGHGGEERASKYRFIAHLIPTHLISLLSSALARHSSRPASSLACKTSARPPIHCSSYSATKSREGRKGGALREVGHRPIRGGAGQAISSAGAVVRLAEWSRQLPRWWVDDRRGVAPRHRRSGRSAARRPPLGAPPQLTLAGAQPVPSRRHEAARPVVQGVMRAGLREVHQHRRWFGRSSPDLRDAPTRIFLHVACQSQGTTSVASNMGPPRVRIGRPVR